MTRFIVLLRGVNVSGKNKLPMQELRDLLKNLDFKNIQTYIQSGNIILDSEISKAKTAETIKSAIFSTFGYDVPLIIKTITELKKAIDNYPFYKENEKIVAFTFLEVATDATEIEIKGIAEDRYNIDKNIIYLYCPSGFARTKLSNNIFEKKLNVTATTRNLRTTLKLLELANQSYDK